MIRLPLLKSVLHHLEDLVVGDQATDERLAELFGWTKLFIEHPIQRYSGRRAVQWQDPTGRKWRPGWLPPAYTRSIDHAITLKPVGWKVRHIEELDNGWWHFTIQDPEKHLLHAGRATTLPIAICIAAVKYRIDTDSLVPPQPHSHPQVVTG